uniref:PIN domain-containing protein n=1 Tax=Candidatus Kentrum sp. TC TaxID=2126339 RepID=A0A451A2U6_9GAMM|nr:MAG: hypothetical protein BECKTC1821F_GA0114240_10458 [Candidatus Kentron sp. TC]
MTPPYWSLDGFRGPLILDASALINIIGTGIAPRFLAALPNRVFVEELVVGEVTRFAPRCAEREETLSLLQRKGLLRVIKMSEREAEEFVDFISAPSPDNLDDGRSGHVINREKTGLGGDNRRKKGE